MRQQTAAAISSAGFHDLTVPAGNNSAPSAVKPHSRLKNAGSIHDWLK